MSWVTINKETCNMCGLCAMRCPHNFEKKDDEIVAHTQFGTCSLCGHCVALCPTDALVHEKMDMENFPKLNLDSIPDREDFVKLVRTRRSHRSYKDKPIPHEDLEKLVDLCRYAPTGSNQQKVGVIVYEDKAKIQHLADLSVTALHAMFAETLEAREAGGITEPFDPVFYQAPAVLVFYGPGLKGESKYDCVIVAQTVVLAAETMGLGSCYIGMFEYAARISDAIKAEVACPEGHSMGSVIILGYPKLQFQKNVDRLPMRVKWE